MGRRSLSKRAGMGKLKRLSKVRDADYEAWRSQFCTRGEVEDMVLAFFERYDRENVADARAITAFLAQPWYRRWLWELRDLGSVVKHTVRRWLRREPVRADGLTDATHFGPITVAIPEEPTDAAL